MTQLHRKPIIFLCTHVPQSLTVDLKKPIVAEFELEIALCVWRAQHSLYNWAMETLKPWQCSGKATVLRI